jgi:hypothetical protein
VHVLERFIERVAENGVGLERDGHKGDHSLWLLVSLIY